MGNNQGKPLTGGYRVNACLQEEDEMSDERKIESWEGVCGGARVVDKG